MWLLPLPRPATNSQKVLHVTKEGPFLTHWAGAPQSRPTAPMQGQALTSIRSRGLLPRLLQGA